MKDNLTPKDITPELVEAVKAYLVARATAEVLREEVDKVRRKVLGFDTVKLYNDLEANHGLERKRITEPNHVYLSEDEGALEYYYEAEDAQVKAEWKLLDEAAKMLDVYEGPGSLNSGLLCMKGGLKKRQEFIDLTVGAVKAAGLLA